jgi:hypothetical protein
MKALQPVLHRQKQVQIILQDQESSVDRKASWYSEILYARSSWMLLYQVRPTWKLLAALSRNVTALFHKQQLARWGTVMQENPLFGNLYFQNVLGELPPADRQVPLPTSCC